MEKRREGFQPEPFLLVILILFVLSLPSKTQAAPLSKKAAEPEIDWIKDLRSGQICCDQIREYRIRRNRKKSLRQLLLTALEPVGSTVYVWGGGWNEADTGAGIDARTIGVSSQWQLFFEQQSSSYDYHDTKYQLRNGLDCSGYIGWCIYNILETENGKPGYVMLAQHMAQNFALRGWGSYTAPGEVRDYRAGDIMSTSAGHVWMVVGACGDGSVVILHASPPGVQLAGTATPSGDTDSQAVALARQYMEEYYPEYYAKFPNCAKGTSYLTDYGRMRWDLSGNVIMSDPDNYRSRTADEILRDLFREK